MLDVEYVELSARARDQDAFANQAVVSVARVQTPAPTGVAHEYQPSALTRQPAGFFMRGA